MQHFWVRFATRKGIHESHHDGVRGLEVGVACVEPHGNIVDGETAAETAGSRETDGGVQSGILIGTGARHHEEGEEAEIEADQLNTSLLGDPVAFKRLLLLEVS